MSLKGIRGQQRLQPTAKPHLPSHRYYYYQNKPNQKVPQLQKHRVALEANMYVNNHGTHAFVGCSSTAGRQVPTYLSIYLARLFERMAYADGAER